MRLGKVLWVSELQFSIHIILDGGKLPCKQSHLSLPDFSRKIEEDSAHRAGENNSADGDERLVEFQCFCANMLLFFLTVPIACLVN